MSVKQNLTFETAVIPRQTSQIRLCMYYCRVVTNLLC